MTNFIDLSGHRILAIDDEADNLQVLKDTLMWMHQANVMTALNLEEAVQCLSSYRPTLVLTDLSMPVNDGYMLLRAFRQRPDTARLPIIALTAHAMVGVRDHVLNAGFDGYITKPFEITLIGRQINDWLELFKSRRWD